MKIPKCPKCKRPLDRTIVTSICTQTRSTVDSCYSRLEVGRPVEVSCRYCGAVFVKEMWKYLGIEG